MSKKSKPPISLTLAAAELLASQTAAEGFYELAKTCGNPDIAAEAKKRANMHRDTANAAIALILEDLAKRQVELDNLK